MQSTARPRLAVLFDLDGTLVDSIPLLLASARHAFRTELGIALREAQWIAGIGTPLRTQLREHTTDEVLVERLVSTYRAFQAEHHDSYLREFEGAHDTVAALHAGGHPLAIVTSKAGDLARRALTYARLAPYFQTIMAVESTRNHKPHPEPVQAALERLSASPDHAIFVGDSIHDIAAGNSAGVPTVAALWGPFSREVLQAAAPRHFLDDIRSLPALIERLEQGSHPLPTFS